MICFLNFGFGCPVQTQKIHSQPVSVGTDGRGLTNGRSLRLHATCLIDSRNEAEAPNTSRQVREFPPAAATLGWINSRGNSSPHRYVHSLTLTTVIWSGLICHVCKSTLCIKYSSVEPYLSHFLNSVPRHCSVPAWRLITEVYYGREKWCVMGLNMLRMWLFWNKLSRIKHWRLSINRPLVWSFWGKIQLLAIYQNY